MFKTDESPSISKSLDETEIRVAKRICLPPQSETPVYVSVNRTGSFILEPKDALYASRMVAMSNGLADTQPYVGFYVKVANFST